MSVFEAELRSGVPLFWANPGYARQPAGQCDVAISNEAFEAACRAWAGMQPLFATLFPAVGADGGISSPLVPIRHHIGAPATSHLLLKEDHKLPVAGSIKARGGFYEVVCHALDVARESGLVQAGDPPVALARPAVKALLSKYRLCVASTGNLGLSVGFIGKALGFEVDVFASREAKTWKLRYLKELGAQVHLVAGDYLSALKGAAELSGSDTRSYFVDDERSRRLFLGYSAAAPEVASQLLAGGYRISREQPLAVYLPCGIGGAPGGIAFGLKQLFGDSVHCFFAEPVASPCMLAALSSTGRPRPSVYDYGLDNCTEADGLAVPRASPLAAGMMRGMLSGIYTVADNELLVDLADVKRFLGERIEPSAAAGMAGPRRLLGSAAGKRYLRDNKLTGRLKSLVHVVWSTGGSLVPEAEHQAWCIAAETLQRERALVST